VLCASIRALERTLVEVESDDASGAGFQGDFRVLPRVAPEVPQGVRLELFGKLPDEARLGFLLTALITMGVVVILPDRGTGVARLKLGDP